MGARPDAWLLLDSSGPGGIETHVRGLAAGLADEGLSAEVVFYQDHGVHVLRKHLDADGLPWRNLDGSFGGLLRSLRQAKPKVLHTHGYKAGILGRLAAHLMGISCVHTYHAGEPGAGRVRLWHALDRWTGVLCHERLAVSAPIAHQLPWRAEEVPNFVGVGEDPFGETVPLHVAFVGRLSHEKGPDLFCQVAERLSGEVSFHVYGDGPLRAALEARYGHCVKFHGFAEDVGAVWRQTGLLLMTSRHEGLPLVALEAMANGVPVTAPAVGALPELIEHGRSGWLFPVGEVDAACACVRAWQEGGSVAVSALREVARATVRAGYSRRAVVGRIVALYERAGYTGDRGESAYRPTGEPRS